MTTPNSLTIDPETFADERRFILGCLYEALQESGEPELAAALPWLEAPSATLPDAPPEHLVQALSIGFQLLKMVEERAAVQYRRLMEMRQGLIAVPALWGEALGQLQHQGISGADIATALSDVQVELVLTAHPTEAKRATVLEHHRALCLLLVKRGETRWTPYEQESIRGEVLARLTTLWRTGEIFLEKPDVASERRNILHYLRNVFPDIVGLLDERLRQAWHAAGLDPALIAGVEHLPRLRFGTRVGTYSDLIGSAGFLTFFRQATPIDALEQSRIGSRPTRRTGQATLADLRAIPWVFSWSQARFFLSGWSFRCRVFRASAS